MLNGLTETTIFIAFEFKPFIKTIVFRNEITDEIKLKMKKALVAKTVMLAFLMGALTVQLTAQNPGGGGRPDGPGPRGPGFRMTEDDVKQRVDNLAETLDLSKEQHKELMNYELEFYTKMQVEFEKFRNQSGPPPDREEMRNRMEKVREERDAKYTEVLTNAQLEKYREIQEQRRQQMRQQYQESNPGAAPEGGRPAGEGERPDRGRSRN